MLRDRQLEAPAAYCEKCRAEVYRSERRYFVDGKWVCEDCFKRHIFKALESSPQIVAMELQIDVEAYV